MQDRPGAPSCGDAHLSPSLTGKQPRAIRLDKHAMPRNFDEYDTVGDALAYGPTAQLLFAALPRLEEVPEQAQWSEFPLGPYLTFALAPDAAGAKALLADISNVESPRPEEFPEAPPVPSPIYESGEVARASARVELPSGSLQHAPLEIVLWGPDHGNPFVDVDVQATFTLTETGSTCTLGAFYDGDGKYILRFLPARPGTWRFETKSNARSLDGVSAEVTVAPSRLGGVIRPTSERGFEDAWGSPYVPLGTTAYAWVHQTAELREQTLASLAASPFNKIRFCTFPKHYLYNSDEPARFVFPRTAEGEWDLDRFDLEFFRALEADIRALSDLGVQADLILFHPYDRWGFSKLPRHIDDRYVRYAVRRLAAFPNVWWSLANEYELLVAKRPEDWRRIAGVIADEDHARHLCSIHNWVEPYDFEQDWCTHASIQGGGTEMAARVKEWRFRWQKPIVVDEFGYEGDLDQGWGNLTAEEVVFRSWSAVMAGAYVTHGETFFSADEVIFWSKGGTLRGESVPRLAFLRQVIEASPSGRLEPLASDFDALHAGLLDECVVIYLGRAQPRFRWVTVPVGKTARIEQIDTWNMTVETLTEESTGRVRIDLPARPHIALRLWLQTV
ncbi:DUF5605 domain-containing protein [Acidothermaceae bacterium B102]|nr:DUF5605 domain-containing protein [Acidothermaceae bacterium B102]